MPVRSWSSPVLTWPGPEAAEAALRAWSDELRRSRPKAARVGLLRIVLARRLGRRQRPWFDTVTGFPVPVDLLVYTVDESQQMEAGEGAFVRRVVSEVVWVG